MHNGPEFGNKLKRKIMPKLESTESELVNEAIRLVIGNLTIQVAGLQVKLDMANAEIEKLKVRLATKGE